LIAGALALAILVVSQILIIWAVSRAIEGTRFSAFRPILRSVLTCMIALDFVTALFAVLPKKH